MCLAVVQACASVSPSKGLRPVDVLGQWEGMSVASCIQSSIEPGRCNAQNRISLRLVEDGSKIRGSYLCAYGNMNCRRANNHGEIVGAGIVGPSLVSFRVQFPDGSSCLFTATINENNARGSYECLAGGSIIEQGSWRAERLY